MYFTVVSEPPYNKMKPGLRRQVQNSHHVSPYSKQSEATTPATSTNKLQANSTVESKMTCTLWLYVGPYLLSIPVWQIVSVHMLTYDATPSAHSRCIQYSYTTA